MQVESQAALRMRVLKIISAHAVVRREPQFTHMIAGHRSFDFYNVGSEFSQNACTSGTCDEMGEIENAITLQHGRLLFHSVLPEDSKNRARGLTLRGSPNPT